MIVYAGAIMVLFVFVIMLLNAGSETSAGRSWPSRILGIPLITVFLGLLAYLLQRMSPSLGLVSFGAFNTGAKEIGRSLFSTYLLPFEVTSILVLIAILGAIVLARKEID